MMTLCEGERRSEEPAGSLLGVRVAVETVPIGYTASAFQGVAASIFWRGSRKRHEWLCWGQVLARARSEFGRGCLRRWLED